MSATARARDVLDLPRARASHPTTAVERLRDCLGDPVIAAVVAMLIVIPLVRTEASTSVVNRNVILELMAVLLWCAVLGRLNGGAYAVQRTGRFLRRGVNAPALLYLAWALFSVLWVAPPGVGRAFALHEWLRLGAGVLVYLAVANHALSRRQIEALLDSLLLVLGLTALYRIFIPRSLPGLPSLIGTRLQASAVLCLLLPVVAAAAMAPLSTARQVATRVVLVLTVMTLLITPSRSSWIGVLAGMALFAGLAFRHRARGTRVRRVDRYRLAYPVLALGGALACLLWLSDLSQQVAARAATVKEAVHGGDRNFAWRWNVWQRTLVDAGRRPLLGLGLGNYPLRQRAFTGVGQTTEQVVRNGPSVLEQAHSEYVQIASELGAPGLLFYLLLVWMFFARSARALKRLPAGGRRILLIGCMAALAAQCVDAASNPAWRYSVCSLYFWLVLGLGAALMRPTSRQRVAAPRSYPEAAGAAERDWVVPPDATPRGRGGRELLRRAAIGSSALALTALVAGVRLTARVDADARFCISEFQQCRDACPKSAGRITCVDDCAESCQRCEREFP